MSRSLERKEGVDYNEPSEGRNINYFIYDPVFQRELERIYPSDKWSWAREIFFELGEITGNKITNNSDVVDENPPRLNTYDKHGELVNEVDYHPAHIENEKLAFESGCVYHSFREPDALDSVPPIFHSLASYYLLCYTDTGLACGVSMTGGAALVLENRDPESFEELRDSLTARNYDNVKQGAMFLTEIQGGSDVGATETVAEPTDEDGIYELTGEKWFCSNIDAEGALALARTPNAPSGTKGLSLFHVPATTDNGDPNSMRYKRLKDKLGTKSVPTGEIELNGARAKLIGEKEEGFRYMTDMLNYERVTNAVGSAGGMGRVLLEAKIHCHDRETFGEKLIEHPLMRRDILELSVEHEAATAFSMEAARLLHEYYRETDDSRALMRVLAPVAKYRTGRMTVDMASYGMEILGGNGYTSEFVTHRMLRDSQVAPIWEGASNIMALDLLRALTKENAHSDLINRTRDLLDVEGHDRVAELAGIVKEHLDSLNSLMGELMMIGEDHAQIKAKDLADYIFDVYTSALFLNQAMEEIESNDDARMAAVAEEFISRYLESGFNREMDEEERLMGEWFDSIVYFDELDPSEL